jgi:hypothetical protein
MISNAHPLLNHTPSLLLQSVESVAMDYTALPPTSPHPEQNEDQCNTTRNAQRSGSVSFIDRASTNTERSRVSIDRDRDAIVDPVVRPGSHLMQHSDDHHHDPSYTGGAVPLTTSHVGATSHALNTQALLEMQDQPHEFKSSRPRKSLLQLA